MLDQARQLRQLVRRRSSAAADDHPARPKLLAVTGAKGGVGATTVALNLAATLARQGFRTALVDADPHGDAAIRCRLEERCTLADVLAGRRTVREALHPGPSGMLLLPGDWGLGDASECLASAQDRLLEQLQGLGDVVDCVVVDMGSGSGRMARRFWQAADLVLVITTPEQSSVMAAYSAIKVWVESDGQIPLATLVTKAPSPEAAAGVHTRLARACLRFLGLQLRGVGHLACDTERPQLDQLAATLAATVRIKPGEP